MPTYDYFCRKCNESFTVIQSIKEHGQKEVTCPKCGGKDVKQQITSFMTKTSRKS